MIINKNTLNISDPKNLYIKSKINNLIIRSNTLFSNFSNDFYKIIHESKDLINNFFHNNWKGIKWFREARVEDFNEYFYNQKRLNALNNLRILDLREQIARLNNNIESTAIKLDELVKPTSYLVKLAEASLTTTATNSIRDEYYPTIRFDTNEGITGSTLNINTDDKTLSTIFIEESKVGYFNIGENLIQIQNDRLLVSKSDNSNILSRNLISNGFYYGKFFDINPIFTDSNNISAVLNGDNDNFYAEYYGNERFVIDLNITPKESKVGFCNIYLGDCSSSPEILFVKIKKQGSDTYEDITSNLFDKGIVIKNVLSQVPDKKAHIISGSQLSGFKLLINDKNITNIQVRLSINTSKEVDYIEYDVLDTDDNVIKRFNYFESLYVNNFQWPDSFSLERANININLINNYLEKGKLVERKRSINKKYISIYKIELNTVQVSPIGEYVSGFIGRGNLINSVELYVDDYIPVGFNRNSIQYFISVDGNEWFPIRPMNKTGAGSTRLIFDINDTNRLNVPSTRQVKLKITMNNNNSDKILKVYSAILRIKEAFNL